ncbi:IPT/TIG domain-containing protein [Myxococcota bacterium]|nr:IPT/TIG domain-containing protein [Myxococcota bacterium]
MARLSLIVTLTAAACGAPASGPALDETTSLYALVATVDGTAFHPPLGPEPVAVSGEFDATLLPRLAVVLETEDAWGVGSTLATFTASTRPALLRHDRFGVYGVNVPAAAYFTDPTLAYRFRVTLDDRELGRSDMSSRIFEVLRFVPTLDVGVKVRIERRASPIATSLSPSRGIAGAGDLALTIAGSAFSSDSSVTFAGDALAVSVRSSTELVATVPAARLATAGRFDVQVTTPEPGGGSSAALTFTVDAASVGSVGDPVALGCGTGGPLGATSIATLPTMTGYASPEGLVEVSSTYDGGWYNLGWTPLSDPNVYPSNQPCGPGCNGWASAHVTTPATTARWSYTLAADKKIRVTSWSLQTTPTYNLQGPLAPRTMTLFGWDGAAWVVLTDVAAPMTWVDRQVRMFAVERPVDVNELCLVATPQYDGAYVTVGLLDFDDEDLSPPPPPPPPPEEQPSSRLDVLRSATATGNTVTVTGFGFARSSRTLSSGKYYVEFGTSALSYATIGICDAAVTPTSTDTSNDVQHSSSCITYGNWPAGGYFYNTPTYQGVPPIGGTDTLAIALDLDARTITFRTNDNVVRTWPVPYAGVQVVGTISWGYTGTFTYNFGDAPFRYAVPAGYSAGF